MATYAYLFKYIIIGDSGVGKSCFMLQFTDRRFKNNHDLTIGVEFGSRTIKVNDVSVKLQMWDTAGQESFKSITRSYYRGAIGALLLFDICNRQSFINLNKWLAETQTNGNPDIVITLVGNKTDLEAQRVVSQEEAKAYADLNNMIYIEASAKTAFNVDKTFVDSAGAILAAIGDGRINLSVEHAGIVVGKNSHREDLMRKSLAQGQNSGCKC
ncbi:Rab2_1 [Blepharisma stoltei]|uniref:Uncharacterized protein n=1 Tax=Blepharisma stoltei TaxID=1481888 RepID=A0AAU9J7S8_9CILI|nr:unnamed protein product [Blepharisma stoltei]